MKRKGIYFLLGLFIIGTISSCLKIDETEEPTREEEQINLKNYIDHLVATGNDVDTTESGIYYITFDEGTGPFPKTGDTLTVGYAGYFPNGYKFDTSDWNDSGDSTYTFVMGNPDLIKGWNEGMKVINKNALVQLIFPSDLAYGGTGGGIIPPFQTLVFVVKMKEIKPSK